jgi:hypothetical protein
VGLLVLLIIAPDVLSLVEQLIELNSCIDRDICGDYLSLAIVTGFYVVFGMVAVFVDFFQLRFWRITTLGFVGISLVLIVYDFWSTPGATILETVLFKFKMVKILANDSQMVTSLYFFCKEFLNPVLLVMLLFICCLSNKPIRVQ